MKLTLFVLVCILQSISGGSTNFKSKLIDYSHYSQFFQILFDFPNIFRLFAIFFDFSNTFLFLSNIFRFSQFFSIFSDFSKFSLIFNKKLYFFHTNHKLNSNSLQLDIHLYHRVLLVELTPPMVWLRTNVQFKEMVDTSVVAPLLHRNSY